MWIAQWLKSRSKENAFGVPVRNFDRVDERLYRGAKPDLAGLRAMHEKLGVGTIVNLIPGDRAEDRQAALEAGIDEWWHHPFSDRETPKTELVEFWLRAVRDARRPPVYMHCKGGRHRTGVLVAVYRVVVYGWTKEHAFEEMKRYGWYDAMGHEPLRLWFFRDFDPSRFE
jgi:protein tyrosine/serine phosphatase